ncbi:hypothetical protein PSTG_19269, partial [Puccinia striiformis f. sp. tritici PST-78]
LYPLEESRISTTTTTTEEPTTTTIIIPIATENPISRIFTADEAIEAFQYDATSIPIRCTYDSKFDKKTLKIQCFEYREINKEIILSNGELETIHVQDYESQLKDVKIIDVKNYTQTYKMLIS